MLVHMVKVARCGFTILIKRCQTSKSKGVAAMAFCFLTGLVPIGGQYPPALEEVQPYVVAGPMVRYAADIKLVLSALIGKEATQKLNLFTPVSEYLLSFLTG